VICSWKPTSQSYADAGDKTRAQKMLKKFEEKARGGYVSPLALAMAHMAVDDLEGTFAWLDKMYAERHPWLILMNEHARYDRLRGDPRFQQLLPQGRDQGADVDPRGRFRLTRPPRVPGYLRHAAVAGRRGSKRRPCPACVSCVAYFNEHAQRKAAFSSEMMEAPQT
jgi:hypothetical protein